MEIAFVGPGRVATAMALALARRRGFAVRVAFGGGEDGGRRFAAATGVPWCAEPDARLGGVDLVLLTVPDAAVARVAAAIAARGLLRPGQVVAHTSGAFGRELLAPYLPAGVAALAFHPVQSLGDPEKGPALLRGAVVGYDGEGKAEAAALALARGLGARAVRIPGERRPLAHAAAVLASNALAALLAVAAEAEAQAFGGTGGREAALAALLPLAEGTMRNLRRRGLPAALTGPVERGDVETVRRDLAALPEEGRQALVALLPVLARLAREKGSIDEATAEAVRALAGGGLAEGGAEAPRQDEACGRPAAPPAP